MDFGHTTPRASLQGFGSTTLGKFPLTELPAEIVLEIVDNLAKKDALALRSACSSLCGLLTPSLLKTFKLVLDQPYENYDVYQDGGFTSPRLQRCNVHGWYDGNKPACNARDSLTKMLRSLTPFASKCGIQFSSKELTAVKEVGEPHRMYKFDPITAPLVHMLTQMPRSDIFKFTTEFVFRFEQAWFRESWRRKGKSVRHGVAAGFDWFCDVGLRRVLTAMTALKTVRVLTRPVLDVDRFTREPANAKMGPLSIMAVNFNRAISMYCAEKDIELHVAAVLEYGMVGTWEAIGPFLRSLFSVISLTVAFPPGPNSQNTLRGRTKVLLLKEIAALIHRSPSLEMPEEGAEATIGYGYGRMRIQFGLSPTEWILRNKAKDNASVWAFAACGEPRQYTDYGICGVAANWTKSLMFLREQGRFSLSTQPRKLLRNSQKRHFPFPSPRPANESTVNFEYTSAMETAPLNDDILYLVFSLLYDKYHTSVFRGLRLVCKAFNRAALQFAYRTLRVYTLGDAAERSTEHLQYLASTDGEELLEHVRIIDVGNTLRARMMEGDLDESKHDPIEPVLRVVRKLGKLEEFHWTSDLEISLGLFKALSAAHPSAVLYVTQATASRGAVVNLAWNRAAYLLRIPRQQLQNVHSLKIGWTTLTRSPVPGLAELVLQFQNLKSLHVMFCDITTAYAYDSSVLDDQPQLKAQPWPENPVQILKLEELAVSGAYPDAFWPTLTLFQYLRRLEFSVLIPRYKPWKNLPPGTFRKLTHLKLIQSSPEFGDAMITNICADAEALEDLRLIQCYSRVGVILRECVEKHGATLQALHYHFGAIGAMARFLEPSMVTEILEKCTRLEDFMLNLPRATEATWGPMLASLSQSSVRNITLVLSTSRVDDNLGDLYASKEPTSEPLTMDEVAWYYANLKTPHTYHIGDGMRLISNATRPELLDRLTVLIGRLQVTATPFKRSSGEDTQDFEEVFLPSEANGHESLFGGYYTIGEEPCEDAWSVVRKGHVDMRYRNAVRMDMGKYYSYEYYSYGDDYKDVVFINEMKEREFWSQKYGK